MSENQVLLGEVVTWDQGEKDLPVSAIRDAIQQAGLGVDVPELRIATAFGRAIKPVKKQKLVRRRKDGAKTPEKKFQLNKIDEDGETINYDYDCTLALDAETGKVACSEDVELAKQVEADVQAALGVRTTADVTKLVQTLFQRNADLFPINPKKKNSCAYFVPACHAEFTAKVEKFLRLVGGNLWRFPVPKGTTEGNDSVRDAVRNGLDEMVAELGAAVDAWDPAKTRISTTEKAQARWEALQYKVSAYAEFLDAEREKLGASLDLAKEKLTARILEVVTEHEKAEQDPEPAPELPQAPRAERIKAREAGWDAYEAGIGNECNPEAGGPLQADWQEGWRAARDQEQAEDHEEAQTAAA